MSVAGWATFAVRFAELGVCRLSPRQLGWDATLGYPGEGPPRRAPRPQVDITTHRVLTEPTLRRRIRLRRELEVYVETFFGASAEGIRSTSDTAGPSRSESFSAFGA